MMRSGRRAIVPALLVCALGLGASATASAAGPGALDASFGAGGVVGLGAGSQLFGVAVQADGKVLAAGQSGGTTLLQRLTVAGGPDPSFGSGGQAAGPGGSGRAVVVAPDGKILVAGGGPGMFVERFNSNGSRDGSFGSGGIAVAGPLGAGAVGESVAIGPDGKIVVAGSVPSGTSTLFAAARFNPNGSPDSGFGSGGAKVLDFGLPYAVAKAVAVQADGKIVLVGREQGSPNYPFFNALAARLKPDGSLDPSFAGSGVISYHKPGGGYDSFDAVRLQLDGKIVIGGLSVEDTPQALALRLNPDGTFDSGFGAAGVASLPSSTPNSVSGDQVGAYGIGIAGGGRVVAAGNFEDNGQLDAALWAFTANGAPEGQFGSGGSVIGPSGGVEACALAVAPDGSLVTVGESASVPDKNPCGVHAGSSAFVARYLGFGPPPHASPPSASTGVASAVTGSARGVAEAAATLTGQINPHGLASSYQFDYGRTARYGLRSHSGTVSAGVSPIGVSARLSGLRPGTRYHYRLVASNPDGTAYGTDRTFTTAPRLKATIRGLLSSYRIAAITGNGLAARVGCNQACSVRAALVISTSLVRRLGLGRHALTLGTVSARRRHAGTVHFRLRLGGHAGKLLAGLLPLGLTLRITTTPVAAGPAVIFSKKVTLTN